MSDVRGPLRSYIEKRGDISVKVDHNGGCRPATDFEVELDRSLIAALARAERMERAAEGHRDNAADRLAQIQALSTQVVALRGALEKTLIKVDWNSDEFHDSKQYNETRQIVLSALSIPVPPLAAAVQGVIEACKDLGIRADMRINVGPAIELIAKRVSALDAAMWKP